MNEIFISIDANEVGKKLEKYILCEQLEELSLFSMKLNASIEELKKLITHNSGHIYMAGGDNVLAVVNENDLIPILSEVARINRNDEFVLSVGIGDTPANAYLAIKYAKVNGHIAVRYTDNVFQLIEAECFMSGECE